MKKNIILFLTLSSYPLFNQLKVTGYFDSKISLIYEFSKKIHTKYIINNNLRIEFNKALNILRKIISKENYKINIELKIYTFQFNSNYIVFFESKCIQIEITPFNSSKNLIFMQKLLII